MGFRFAPSVVLAFFAALLTIEYGRTNEAIPSFKSTEAAYMGQAFLSYCNSVASYQGNNPTFNGTVSASALATQGTPVPASISTLVGNAITAFGSSGHTVTCYGMLTPGAMKVAIDKSGNDASLGMVNGTNWMSIAPGSIPTALATAVPNGAIVYVFRVGA